MLKNLVLVIAIAMSGMAHADFQTVQDSEVQKADAGDALGGLLAALILGKIIKEATDDDDDNHKPVAKTQRVRIPMGGELAVGPNTIFLKQELRDMGVIPRNRVLKKVVLVAKSKKGNAQAYLQLGNKEKPTKTIGRSKNGFGFKANAKESYHRIQWNANRPAQGGPWQIHMRGRIKVKAVIVELQ